MALPRSLQSYSKLGKGDNKWVRHNRQGSSNSKSDGRVYRQTDKCEYNKGPRSSGTADGIKCIRQATTSGVKTRFKPSNRYLSVRKALVPHSSGQSLLPRQQRRAHSRTPFPRPIQVLQSDQCGVYPGALALVRVVSWECDFDRRVVHCDPCLDALE